MARKAAKKTKKRKTPPPKEEEDNTHSDDAGEAEDNGAIESVTVSKIPSTPHPAVQNLAELEFENLPEGFFVIEYGVRRTGKTHATGCLVEPISKRFDFCYLFSATCKLHKNSKDFYNFDFIREEAKFDHFDEEVLGRILERQETVMQFNNECKYERDKKPNKTLIIFDDFVHDKAIRYSKLFTTLPVLGRHLDVSVICLTQGYTSVGSGGLNKATRENADLVMTFMPRNTRNVESLAEWYLTKEKVEGMWLIATACQEKHRALAIDLSNPNEQEYEDYCYTYKAPPTIPKFECGKVQWRLYHEERKRAKKAALAAELDKSGSWMHQLDDLDKMARIGQATGQPPQKKAKMSLFDACNGATSFSI